MPAPRKCKQGSSDKFVKDRSTKKRRAPTSKARKSKMPKSDKPYIDTIAEAQTEPFNFCPNANCESRTKCPDEIGNEICDLYHPICNCKPRYDFAAAEARIDQMDREILAGLGNGWCSEEAEQSSFPAHEDTDDE